LPRLSKKDKIEVEMLAEQYTLKWVAHLEARNIKVSAEGVNRYRKAAELMAYIKVIGRKKGLAID
jgi:hypothetical protein